MSISLIPFIQDNAASIAAIRRSIHSYPELGFKEQRTSDLVANTLENWGIEVHRGIGRTGLVGVIKGRLGNGGKAIGLRADMDALAMPERNNFAHASKIPGQMHGCGHDGHVAMLLSAAQYLASTRNYDGTVYLIFQPGEETGRGAQAMIDDGLFVRFPMDSVFGIHNWPAVPEGHFSIASGPMMASASKFTIKIIGKGGHAALPHLAIDPIPISAQIISAYQNIISRNVKPIDSAVISITAIKAGDVFNVIPNECTLMGTVRTFSEETLTSVKNRMQKISRQIADAFDAKIDFEFTCLLPATVNDPVQTEFARSIMREVVGEKGVMNQEPTMGGEDFAYMLNCIPGAYAFLGNGDGNHREPECGAGPCELHNPSYDFNDALIPIGGTYFSKLVERKLAVSSDTK